MWLDGVGDQNHQPCKKRKWALPLVKNFHFLTDPWQKSALSLKHESFCANDDDTHWIQLKFPDSRSLSDFCHSIQWHLVTSVMSAKCTTSCPQMADQSIILCISKKEFSNDDKLFIFSMIFGLDKAINNGVFVSLMSYLAGATISICMPRFQNWLLQFQTFPVLLF